MAKKYFDFYDPDDSRSVVSLSLSYRGVILLLLFELIARAGLTGLST